MQSDWIKKLISGSGVINLKTLTLSGTDIGVVTGHGRIEWDSKGKLVFHAFVPDGRDALRKQFYGRFRSDRKSGTVISDGDCIQVSGETPDGYEISARSTDIWGFQPFNDDSIPICELYVGEVTQTAEISSIQPRYGYVHAVFEPSLDQWSRESITHDKNPYFGVKSQEYDWLMCETKIGTFVARTTHTGTMHVRVNFNEFTSEESVDTKINIVKDAMSFLTGRECILRGYESVCCGGRKVVLRLGASSWKTTDNHVQPPLSFDSLIRDSIENLLTCAIDYFQSEKGQRIANYLYIYRDSADNSFELKVAVACTCLEGLLTTVFDADNMSGSRVADPEIEKFLQWYSENPPPYLKKRIDGLLKSLDSRRPQDILNQLQDDGMLNIKKDDIKAWSKLRNSTAHARFSAPKDDVKKQKLIDRFHRVQTMINKVALHAMQYEGTYSDYSQRGYPYVPFPPSKFSGEIKLLDTHDDEE